jgi:prevent-host-death family protein
MTKRTVDVHEAKTHLSRLLERAHTGEEVVLANAGEPYARLVPLEQKRERKPGRLKGLVTLKEEFFEPLPEEELAAWEGAGDGGVVPGGAGRGRVAIVDASNVANSAPSATARLEYLTLVTARLAEAGWTPVVVADAGLVRRIDDRAGYLRRVEEGAIRVAPPGSEADELILRLARELGAVVVSNDRFREWRARYPEEVARRVGFRVRDGVAELRGI